MLSSKYLLKDIHTQIYKKTLIQKNKNFQNFKLPYYGLTPHTKGVNNIPITEWFNEAKIFDVM